MKFNNIIGHSKTKNSFIGLLEKDKLPHAIMLAGNIGIGKFLFARAMATLIIERKLPKTITDSCNINEKIFNCTNILYIAPSKVKGSKSNGDFNLEDYLKLIELLKINNKTGKIPIGLIHFIISQLKYKTAYNEGFVVIIRNAEKMTKESQNAILKTLEEPPDNVYFILTTSNEMDLLPTIRSRSYKILMNGLKNNDMKLIIEKFNIDKENIDTLVLLSQGSPGKLHKYSTYDVNSVKESVIESLKSRNFNKLISDISKNYKDKYQLDILNQIYREIFFIVLRDFYIDNESTYFHYDFKLPIDRVNSTIEKLVAVEKNSIYNLSKDIEWGTIFYSIFGG